MFNGGPIQWPLELTMNKNITLNRGRSAWARKEETIIIFHYFEQALHFLHYIMMDVKNYEVSLHWESVREPDADDQAPGPGSVPTT